MITFHELYERYAPEVYRFALWLSGNSADAEDITAETFTRAWAGRQRIQTETVKAYLFTIARNLFLKQSREHRRYLPLDQAQVDRSPGPERRIEDSQLLKEVLSQLQLLPEVDRTALILRVQHELPYVEIARILNLSLASAKVKVHRARLKLAAVRTGEEVL